MARDIDLTIYAAALRTYVEATDNVIKNGAICQHPRTGAPIETPYLRVQALQVGILRKMRNVVSERVMRLLEKALDEK
jgi:hypothetical protein